MVELIGGAGADDAEVIGDFSQGGEGGAEGGAGFTVLLEFELRPVTTAATLPHRAGVAQRQSS